MITENGIVSQADVSTAWVKTIRSGACEGCSSRESCGTSHNAKEMIVMVKNTLGVEKGDQVVIGLESKPMIVLSFFLYVFPILLLITGAVIGDSLAPALGMNKSFCAMILGFSFFGAAFLVIRRKQATLSQKEAFKPFLVRKKSLPDSGQCRVS
ncbi:MAG: SoxR reducing system RseC family protein [Proteobacteria bacterium]|nr:SoxR reducing system RseC family protein [Desulfobacula sp.]MBU3953773.1 SoxR reducing system RseC family protein [Pseudomonadota bacterium]MBU4130831.1 SoxR reducing system RseC family protein [Pseudomonadota bacterium]